jgi:hypothetical protein
MQVFLHLPEKYLPDAARQEAWKSGTITKLEEGGKAASAQAWIYQTWMELRKTGCAVELTHDLPDRGILITLAGCVGTSFRPGPDLFFADIVADGLPHPGAHLHIVQNAVHARQLPRAVYLPHWPHPNLLPRDPARGDRFENLGFFGDAANLAPALRDPSWRQQLRDETGLNLRVVSADHWHDYREMDGILGIRDWGHRPWLRKPATKLYNAWLAGAPFIGGMDSAYQADGRPGENYLAAATLAELDGHLRRLKNDPDLRHRLVAAGTAAVRSFRREAITHRWKTLVESTLPGAAARWARRSAPARALFWKTQAVFAWVDRRFRN